MTLCTPCYNETKATKVYEKAHTSALIDGEECERCGCTSKQECRMMDADGGDSL